MLKSYSVTPVQFGQSSDQLVNGWCLHTKFQRSMQVTVVTRCSVTRVLPASVSPKKYVVVMRVAWFGMLLYTLFLCPVTESKGRSTRHQSGRLKFQLRLNGHRKTHIAKKHPHGKNVLQLCHEN